VREECRPLAEAIIKGRKDRGAQDELRRWTKWMWYFEPHDFVPPLPHGRPVTEMEYDRIQDQYSWLVWWVMWPWANEYYHGDIVQMDRVLLTFSLDFIRHHPDIYAMCVLEGWGRALEFAVLRLASCIPLIIFGVMLLLAGVVRLAVGKRSQPAEPEPAAAVSARQRLTIFTWTVVSFFLFKIQLAAMVVAIMMVWDIDGRYADTASLMLPCLPMLGIYYLGRYVLRKKGMRDEG